MKNICFFVAFLALFILPFKLALSEDSGKSQLYDYNSSLVNPLCFLNNIGTQDNPIYATRDCSREGLNAIGEVSSEGTVFVGTAYEQRYSDPETGETLSYRGWIGYRAIGMVEYEGRDLLALVLAENSGGSGRFTTVMLVDPVRDEIEETLSYHHVKTLAVGDRCMGGYRDAWVEDGALVFRLDTTMADMLGLVGDTDREILKNEAAQNLPLCAVCCYAEVEYKGAEFQGVFFSEDRKKPAERDSEAAHCVEELVDLNVTHARQDYFEAEDFGYFVREIEHTCLGRMEGE